MERAINNENAMLYGIVTKHDVMSNGEKRFRLISDDGSAYIRTEGSEKSGWQNSHSHSTLHELYVVQSGWLIAAQYINEAVEYKRIESGEMFICTPSIPHNIFVSANSTFHTLKYGDVSKSDWIKFDKLDSEIICIQGEETNL